MYESKKQRVISRRAFHQRLLKQVLAVLVIITFSLGMGVWGYHTSEHLSWLDSLLNASMILGGMGEVDPLKTTAGKLFASFYALYSGFFLIICGGLLFVPVFHRVLHKFHADT